MPSRFLGPVHARAAIDAAAVTIAADPGAWRNVVLDARSKLGRTLELPKLVTSRTVHFVASDEPGALAYYPIEPPRRIGDGGFSTVDESRDLITGHPIIVRSPICADTTNGESLTSAVEDAWRLERMAAVPKYLRAIPHHPVIPRFLASGTLVTPHGASKPCEVYDKAPGVSLRKFVHLHGLNEGQLIDIVWHAARALAHLHQHGFVHGDVKPENFCVDEWQGTGTRRHTFVRLIDYDTIATVPEQRAEILLGTRLTGTLMFMPPESFVQHVPDAPEEEAQMIHAKDVYALGMTIGRVLGSTPTELLAAQATDVIAYKKQTPTMEFNLPPHLPIAFQELVADMTNNNWRERPTMPEVLTALASLRTSMDAHVQHRVVLPPHAGMWTPHAPKQVPIGDRLGPYKIIQRDVPFPGATHPLSLLEDRHGRRLIGVRFDFETPESAEIFYHARTMLLRDLNALRRRRPELFPGTFRDLVREERVSPAPTHRVWLIRPYLDEKVSLDEYVKHIEPQASLRRRLDIIAAIAESLTELEEAGFHHPGVTPRSIFFVAEGAHATAVGRKKKRYRQELMEMASVRHIDPEAPDRTPQDIWCLMHVLRIPDRLGDRAGELQSFQELPTWRARLVLLQTILASLPDEPVDAQR